MLTINKLSCTLGGKNILQDVSLSVSEGEIVGLVGPNGCGKSTLMKHAYRVYKPPENTVFIRGRDVRSMSSGEFARNAAVLGQENPVTFDITVIDMIRFGRFAKRNNRNFLKYLSGGINKSNEGDICRKYLMDVGLSGYESRSYLSLSGGEKQRVLLARALAQECPLLLLDEPTNHLDVRYQYGVMDIVCNLKTTVFAVLHDLNIAAMYCDRIIMMDEGHMVANGSPQEVLNEKNIEAVFHMKTQITINPITRKRQIYFLPK